MKSLIATTLILCAGLAACANAREGVQSGPAVSATRSGGFTSVGRKHVEGQFSIHTASNNELVLILEEDFLTQSGPDLRVVLRDSTGKTPMITVDSLLADQGQQLYILPITEAELEKFDQVVIYCQQAHVDFGIASLR